jgi:hypothetical protein
MSDKYTIKDHLDAHDAGAEAFHKCMSKCDSEKAQGHEDAANIHDALEQPELAKAHRRLAKAFHASAEHHDSEAERHGEMRKMGATITKSLGNPMLENLGFIPDGVSGLVPEHRAVPRFGAPDINKSAPVDPELSHLVEIED